MTIYLRNLNLPYAASLCLLSLISVLPLVQPYHVRPLTSFYSEWVAFALGVAACILFLGREVWLNFRVPKVTLWILTLALLVLGQSPFVSRAYLGQTLMPLIYLVWAALLCVVASSLTARFGAERVATVFGWFLFVGSLLHALIGLMQYLGVVGPFASVIAFKSGVAITGNIAQANHFSTHLTLGVVAIAHLFTHRKLSCPTVLVLVGFYAFIAILSGSRSTVLYAAVFAALSIGFYRRDRIAGMRFMSTSGYFLVALLASHHLVELLDPLLTKLLAEISLNAAPFANQTAIDRASVAGFGLELRLSEWAKAWRMFTESPILGVGIGNYAWHSFQLQSLPEFSGVVKSQLFGHSHNIFLQVLAELGLVGFTILVGLILTWSWQFRGRMFTPHGMLIIGLLLVVLIHSNLEFPLWYSYYLGIVAFLLGVSDCRTLRVTFSLGLGRVGATASMLLMFSILWNTLYSYRQIASIPDPLIPPEEQVNLVLAHGSNPILRPYAENVLITLMPPNKDGIEHKFSITTRAFRRNPDSYKSYRQVIFMALSGQLDSAKELLDKVATIYPHHLEVFVSEIARIHEPEIVELRKHGWRLLAARRGSV